MSINEIFAGFSDASDVSTTQQHRLNGRAEKKTRTDAPQQLAAEFENYIRDADVPSDKARYVLDLTEQDKTKDWYTQDNYLRIYNWTGYVYIATLGTDKRRSTYGHYTVRTLSMLERAVLSYVYQYSDYGTHAATIIISRLKEVMNTSRQNITDILNVLTDAKLIIRMQTADKYHGVKYEFAQIKIHAINTKNSETMSTRIDIDCKNNDDIDTLKNETMSTRIDIGMSTRIDNNEYSDNSISECADAHRAHNSEADKEQSEDGSKKKPTAKSNKPERRMYGEFNNIPFTDAEYQTAIERYGEQYLTEKINDMSAYYENNPKKPHNNGLALLRTWTRKDREFANNNKQLQAQTPQPTASSDLSDVNEK